MQYSANDTIKLSMDDQDIVRGYTLICPYVKVRSDWNSEHADGFMLWASGDFHNQTTGVIYRNNPYYFNARNSILVEEAQVGENVRLYPQVWQNLSNGNSTEWVATHE